MIKTGVENIARDWSYTFIMCNTSSYWNRRIVAVCSNHNNIFCILPSVHDCIMVRLRFSYLCRITG